MSRISDQGMASRRISDIDQPRQALASRCIRASRTARRAHHVSSNQPKGRGHPLDRAARPSVVIGDQTPRNRSGTSAG